ncbi:class I SAM-dependent methyltransferase [Flavobacterium lacustre]|uniref:class I SAM-dependent methyltransferase n=1 Tax=Flavobacterium lacustre TaxID=3016339 RepID=UPI0022B60CC1|nr:class I SAM-dependent methyltransferase [Flavobacterium lacustre]
MQKNTTYISVGDFLDVYHKIREKGLRYLMSKVKLLPTARIESKWDSYASTSDFWLIPAIQHSWNKMISGHPEMEYEEYVAQKYLSNKRNLKLLSIGCGEGSHDRNFAKQGCFSLIDGIDISPESIKNAVQSAKENNVDINYFQGDFKKMKLNSNSYDVILFSSSLHHFKDVEATLQHDVKPLLKPDGILVIYEFTGPNRLQWTKEQLDKANELLRNLPLKFKMLSDKSSVKKKVYRPGLLRMLLVDPSEAIDSESIVPSLNKHFKVLEQTDLGWNILHILLKGIAQNFLNEEPETKKIIDFLIAEEADFVKKQLKSDAIFGVYQNKNLL